MSFLNAPIHPNQMNTMLQVSRRCLKEGEGNNVLPQVLQYLTGAMFFAHRAGQSSSQQLKETNYLFAETVLFLTYESQISGAVQQGDSLVVQYGGETSVYKVEGISTDTLNDFAQIRATKWFTARTRNYTFAKSGIIMALPLETRNIGILPQVYESDVLGANPDVLQGDAQTNSLFIARSTDRLLRVWHRGGIREEDGSITDGKWNDITSYFQTPNGLEIIDDSLTPLSSFETAPIGTWGIQKTATSLTLLRKAENSRGSNNSYGFTTIQEWVYATADDYTGLGSNTAYATPASVINFLSTSRINSVSYSNQVPTESGRDGEIVIVRSTGTLYEYFAGEWFARQTISDTQKGDAGTDGKDGNTIYAGDEPTRSELNINDLWITDTGWVRRWDGTKYEDLFTITGAKGEKGDKGDEGDKGEIGNTGAQGVQGNKGDAGAKGAKGDRGLTGDTGDAGEQGQMGMQGQPGIQGPRGLTGDTGREGDQGPMGMAGQDGEKGDKGDRGDVGRGVIGGGLPGQFYARVGATGTGWVDAPSGGGGEPGTGGVSISDIDNRLTALGVTPTLRFLSGIGAPAEELGEVNYTYINLSNGDIYKRTNAGWGDPLLTLQGLQGEKGDKGEQGDAGGQGAKGDRGDAGQQGIPGEQGAMGVKGATGDRGLRGFTGTSGNDGEKGDPGDPGRQGQTGPGYSGVTQTTGDNFIDATLTPVNGAASATIRIPTGSGGGVTPPVQETNYLFVERDTATPITAAVIATTISNAKAGTPLDGTNLFFALPIRHIITHFRDDPTSRYLSISHDATIESIHVSILEGNEDANDIAISGFGNRYVPGNESREGDYRQTVLDLQFELQLILTNNRGQKLGIAVN